MRMKFDLTGKIQIVIVATIACCAICLFCLNNSNEAIPSPVAWDNAIQQAKKRSFSNSKVVEQNNKRMVLQYRIFRPAINLLEITREPENWQNDPFDSFLRMCYVDYLDPNPSFTKCQQSYLDGQHIFERLLQIQPQYAENENRYFEDVRSDIKEIKLLGEVVIDDVHMFVYASIDANDTTTCGGITMVAKDGKFYNDPEAKGRYDVLINMSADKYHEILQHFPEYKVKDE